MSFMEKELIMGKVGFLATAGTLMVEYVPELKKKFEEDMNNVIKTLEQKIEIVCPGLITNEEEGEKVGEQLNQEDLDMLILCEFSYSRSWVPLSALEKVKDIPLLIWMYLPIHGIPEDLDYINMARCSGINGVIEITQTLRRLGKDFSIVIGTADDQETIREIVEYAQVATLARELKKIRIAWLPHRFDIMPDTWEDEFKFTQFIGPRVMYVSAEELREEVRMVSDEKARWLVDWMKSNTKIKGPSEKEILLGARLSLGLENLAIKRGISAIAILQYDQELIKAIGINPEIPVKNLDDRGIMVGMEGDLSTTIAMWILHRLTGSPVLFIEFLSFDKKENTVLLGHSGCSGIKMARNYEIIITPIIPPKGTLTSTNGLVVEFIAKPGKVTLLNISCDAIGYKMIAISGQAIDTPPRPISMPHAIVKLDKPIDVFFKELTSEGVKHHFALVHGNIISKLEKLAKILNIRFRVI